MTMDSQIPVIVEYPLVIERRVNLLVYSLSLHRHSYIGFILAVASSIHNKQTKQSDLWLEEVPLRHDGRPSLYLSGTCTTHSGVKKDHDWVVDQLTDLVRTTHTVKTQHVTKVRCRYCADMELTTYLVNTVVPVPLVLDLHIDHDRFGSNSDLNLNGHLHYPNDIDRSLSESATDKIRKYRSD